MLLLYHSQVNTDCAVQWLRKKWHHQRKDWFHVNLACTMLVMLSLTNYFTKEVHLPLSNQKRKTHCFPSRYPQVTVGKRNKKKNKNTRTLVTVNKQHLFYQISKLENLPIYNLLNISMCFTLPFHSTEIWVYRMFMVVVVVFALDSSQAANSSHIVIALPIVIPQGNTRREEC